MKGLITNRHLVTNAADIIHEFGVAAYLRCLAACLFAHRPVTFLDLVARHDTPHHRDARRNPLTL